jgi:plasmid stabilization system protein ParE
VQAEFSPLAVADLQEIGDYIAQDNPLRAETFVDELIDQAEKIAQMPTSYAAREECFRPAHVRARALHPLFPGRRLDREG